MYEAPYQDVVNMCQAYKIYELNGWEWIEMKIFLRQQDNYLSNKQLTISKLVICVT